MEQYDSGWRPWPVVWSAVIVGALSALAVGLVIGLIGFSVGAHEVSKAATWKNVRLITLIFNIGGAFFAFVVGGWVAARIAGFRRAEPAVLHGAIAWLVTLPILMLLAATGTLASYGGWLGSLAGVYAPPTPGSSAADIAGGPRQTGPSEFTPGVGVPVWRPVR